MCRIKIIKAVITDSQGKEIIKPNDKVLSKKEIEKYRSSLKKEPDAKVLLTYEELG